MQWRSRRSDPAELAVLHPGVPPWMHRPLLLWVGQVMTLYPSNFGLSEAPVLNKELLQEFETATRRTESLVGVERGGIQVLYDAMGTDEFLDYTDFLIFHVERLGQNAQDYLDNLNELLSDAGSEWTVGERGGHASLEKMVPEGVAVAVDEVISQGASSGRLLGEAWHAAFGRSPDAEEAYEKAIKAVEEAGAHVVSPKNSKATLGSMISDMKAQGDWKLDLSATDADVPVKMAEALWIGQESRHGGNGYRKPTQAEAEAAVLLAVPLVQWFASGAIQRRP